MGASKALRIRLHGPFSVRTASGEELDLRGARNRALLALLLTAPEGKRSRTFIRGLLWASRDAEHGMASLRSALSAVRSALGPYASLISCPTKEDIVLDLSAVGSIGTPADGAFLEGIEIPEKQFQSWVARQCSDLAPAVPLTRHQATLRPSVAVLPLVCVQPDAGQAPIGDLLAQEVTRALSRSLLLDVISHLSCRNIGARHVGLNQIRQDLGCDYLVCGTLRLNGGRYRMDVDLIETTQGRVIWTDSFAEALSAAIEGQSRVLPELAAMVGQSIVQSLIELAGNRPLNEIETHKLITSGITLMYRQNFKSYSRARTYLRAAAEQSPDSAEVQAWMAKWYALHISQGWTEEVATFREQAAGFARKALDLDPENPFALTINGYINNNLFKRSDNSMHQYEQALALEPSNSMARLLKGALHAFMDEGDLAIEECERARGLSPIDPQGYFYDTLAATAYLSKGRYEEALQLAERAVAVNRRHVSTLRVRTIALQALDRGDEAKQAASELRRRQPDITVSNYLDKHPAAAFRTGREWASMLRAAGVPD